MEISEGLDNSRKYEILIVDDVPANIQLLGNILVGENYEISFASSGQQALDAARFSVPDLILLDISMPEMNGFEVTEHLKADERTRDIPVLFLTAMSNVDNIVKGFELGGVDYITKPFNTQELLSRVRTHIELKQKREKLAENFRVLGNLNKQLTDSINYAQIIQKALLPSEEHLHQHLGEAFLFSLPRDTLGGDFFYVGEIKGKIVLILADGTGHGVPGAIISTLGISLINQIVVDEQETNPARIQEKLNQAFTSLLVDNAQQIRIGDGMDAAICTIDPEAGRMQFSGSKRPAYVMKNGEITRVRGSRFSIGGLHYNMVKDFTNKEIDIEGDEYVYLFSDGYADQFGGPQNKKFKYSNMRQLLSHTRNYNPQKQKEIIEEHFYNWKSDNEQVDDVLFIGFKPASVRVAVSQEH